VTEQTIRLSDSEREAAAADLGEHFAQGRLTAEEHGERLERIWGARTRGEIAPIFSDLPSPYSSVAVAPPPRETPRTERRDGYWSSGPRPFRRGVPTPLLVVLAVLIVVTVVTHLPLVVLGFGVFWFVVLRHRHPWHRRGHSRRPA